MKASNDPSNISLPSLQEEDLLEIPITPSKFTTSKLLSPSFRNPKMTSSPHSSPSQSTAAHRGLGIKITRRPSDTVLSTISQRTSSVSSSLSTMTSNSQIQHHQQQQIQPLSSDKLSSQIFGSDVDLPSPQGPSNSNATSSADRRPLSSESSDGSEATVGSNSRLSSMSSVSSTDFTRFQSALKSNQMALQPMVPTTPQQQQVPHQISQIASHNFQSMPTLVNQRSISQSTISSSSSTLNQQDHNRRALVRRNTAKSLSKAEKKKLYDELEEEGDDDITEQSCVFNVPLAMHSTTSLINNSSSNSKSSEILNRAWNNNDRKSAIPPSPLPGTLASYHNEKHQYQQQLQLQQLSLYVPQSKPTSKLPPAPPTNNSKQAPKRTGGADYLPSPTLSKHSSFKNLSPMAQQLTKFYEYSIHNHLDNEFNKRSKLVNKIPSHYNMLKDKEQKLEDLRLISNEKIDSLTITRPTWLPPKNKHESLKHEKEFQKMVELQGKLLKPSRTLRI